MAPRHFAWQAWHSEDFHLRFAWQAWPLETFTLVLRGRCDTYGTGWRAWTGLVADDAVALCVAGVALGDIHLRVCVAGKALGNIHLRFAWQAWHLWHCVMRLDRISRRWRRGTLRGRRGTRRHSPSFCVTGVALGHINLRFAWEA